MRSWGADGPPAFFKNIPETFWSLLVFKVERRTVRPWGADGPPANFNVVPETMFVSGGVEHLKEDGPPLGRGRSARAVTASSDMY